MHRCLEVHTAHRYDGELNSLHLQMLEMGGLVTDHVNLALKQLRPTDWRARINRASPPSVL